MKSVEEYEPTTPREALDQMPEILDRSAERAEALERLVILLAEDAVADHTKAFRLEKARLLAVLKR